MNSSKKIATPTPRQLLHHARECYGFVHFTTNTFTDKEWGFGDESPAIFNPTAFDADQIIDSARIAGMKGLILTCKHHDGFCLWPSKYTQHSVRNSPFREGKGDVVREIEQACRRAGLEFGVYLSPWDRNHPAYGTSEYITYYRAQLRELLTDYGDIFEVWFDGANGGDGFYGGANEKRSIDNRTYYDWQATWQMVRELQPNAVMFSDAGPDVRWNGNESGIAGDPCWCSINAQDLWPGHADQQQLNRGDADGSTWLIPECDVSIRPGWFYHEIEDQAVRSPKNLVDLYFASIGRGATFLLNLPPDRRGLIPEIDRNSLRAFRAHLDQTFALNLAAEQANHQGWQMIEGRREWVLECNLKTSRKLNTVELREDIQRGHRIRQWHFEARDESGRWINLAQGHSIGHCRLARFNPVHTPHFRLRVSEALDEPLICKFGLYIEPDLAESSAVITNRLSTLVVSDTPVQRVLDLSETLQIKAISYTPDLANRVTRYEISFATNPGQWGDPLSGEFGNIQFNASPQVVMCHVKARFIRFRAVAFCVGASLRAAEIVVIGK